MMWEMLWLYITWLPFPPRLIFRPHLRWELFCRRKNSRKRQLISIEVLRHWQDIVYFSNEFLSNVCLCSHRRIFCNHLPQCVVGRSVIGTFGFPSSRRGQMAWTCPKASNSAQCVQKYFQKVSIIYQTWFHWILRLKICFSRAMWVALILVNLFFKHQFKLIWFLTLHLQLVVFFLRMSQPLQPEVV